MDTRFGGVERIIELLLENRADLNIKDVWVITALDEAKSRALFKVVSQTAQAFRTVCGSLIVDERGLSPDITRVLTTTIIRLPKYYGCL